MAYYGYIPWPIQFLSIVCIAFFLNEKFNSDLPGYHGYLN